MRNDTCKILLAFLLSMLISACAPAAESDVREASVEASISSLCPELGETSDSEAKNPHVGVSHSPLEPDISRAREAGDRKKEAELLVLLSDEANGAGDRARAEELLRHAVALFSTLHEPWNEATTLLQSGVLAHQQGRLEAAEAAFLRTIRLARDLPQQMPESTDPPSPARRLMEATLAGKFDEYQLRESGFARLAMESFARLYVGRLLFEVRRESEAAVHLQAVLEASKTLGPSLEASAHHLLGTVAARQKDFRQAREHFERSLRTMGGSDCGGTAKAFPDTCFEVLEALADLEDLEGNSEAALARSREAFRAAEILGDPVQQLYVLAKRCSLYPRFGNRELRRQLLEEGEALLPRVTDFRERATASIHLAVMAMCAGQQEKMLAYALKAEQLLGDDMTPEYDDLLRGFRRGASIEPGDQEGWKREQGHKNRNTASPRTENAGIFIETIEIARKQVPAGDRDQAAVHLQQIIESLAGDMRVKTELLDIAARMGEETELTELSQLATRFAKTLFPMAPEDDQFASLAPALEEAALSGQVERLTKTLDEITTDCLTRGIESSKDLSDFYSSLRLFMPDQKAALEHAKARITKGELCVLGARLDETFLRLAEQSRLDFEVLVTLQVRSHLFADAFKTAEGARGYSLMRWLGRPRPDPKEGGDPQLVQEMETSKVRIRKLEGCVERLTSSDAETVYAELLRERSRYEDFLLRMKLTTPGYSELAASEVADLGKVQSSLPDRTALVSYFTMADQTVAWVIKRHGWQEMVIPISQSELAAKVKSFRRWAARDWETPRGTKSANNVEEASSELAQELYRTLISPLALDGSEERLLLVPHGSLHQLPFAALKDQRTGVYLAEQHTLSLLPSASALVVWPSSEASVDGGSLLLGNPATSISTLGDLERAEDEAKEVAKLLELAGISPIQVFVTGEAKESTLRAQAPGLSLLHVAAHGVQVEGDPRKSFLALAEDADHDGRLEMGEVFDELRFSKRPLVVLSACESGLGRRAGGDEIEGFIRAFLYAGSGAVAATLWNIADEASMHLMTSFFERLVEGVPAAGALQMAQKEMIASSRYSAPYFWAGFAMTGDPTTGLRRGSRDLENRNEP